MLKRNLCSELLILNTVKFEQITHIIGHQQCVKYGQQDDRLFTFVWHIYYLWNRATLFPLAFMLSQALAELHESALFSHLASGNEANEQRNVSF